MPAAEHIERQITVVVVIAVEETLFLMPVQRVVGGVEVQGDLRRRRRMGVEKQVDKQSLDRRRRSAPRAAKWKLRKINISESMLSFSLPISLHARRSP